MPYCSPLGKYKKKMSTDKNSINATVNPHLHKNPVSLPCRLSNVLILSWTQLWRLYLTFDTNIQLVQFNVRLPLWKYTYFIANTYSHMQMLGSVSVATLRWTVQEIPETIPSFRDSLNLEFPKQRANKAVIQRVSQVDLGDTSETRNLWE